MTASAPSPSRPPIVARVSDRGVVVEVEDRLYLRLDAEGRWIAFGEGGVLFRRAVDGRVLRPRGRGFETLTEAQAASVDAWVVRRAGEVLEALHAADDASCHVLGTRAELETRLRDAACGRDADARAYAEAYPEPVPILPPHRYRDVVVQPATGCPNHSCAFCAFYRDRPFRVLDLDAFRTHLEAVRDLFGKALADRDGIFLGSASALTIPDEPLVERLRAVREVLGLPRRGIASFFDPDRGRPRTPANWRRLVDEGLVEATLGLETGLGPLRAAQGKSADLERVVETVRAQKEGGLKVSLTVLVGLGGEAQAAPHRDATVRVLARMPLGEGDRVYLSTLGGTRPDEELEGWRRLLGERVGAAVGEYRIERFAFLA